MQAAITADAFVFFTTTTAFFFILCFKASPTEAGFFAAGFFITGNFVLAACMERKW